MIVGGPNLRGPPDISRSALCPCGGPLLAPSGTFVTSGPIVCYGLRRKPSSHAETPSLELRDVRLHRGQKPWQLTLHKGEILGLGGLQGQGQRLFLESVTFNRMAPRG